MRPVGLLRARVSVDFAALVAAKCLVRRLCTKALTAEQLHGAAGLHAMVLVLPNLQFWT
jgi:hypothetical protein